jgi:ABC-2 type transport system permease protein
MNPTGPRATVRNILTVARREFTWRGRTRTFAISTAILVVMAVGVALAPVLLRVVSRLDTADRLAVHEGTAAPTVAVAPALEALLNATRDASLQGTQGASPGGFIVTTVTDLAVARADVEAGRLKGVLALERTAAGDLAFTLYSKMQPFERTPQLIQQAVTALTIQDRLARKGIPPGDQALLFAPPAFEHAPPSGPATGPGSTEQLIGGSIIGFALTIFIFIAIMLYGQWVAMSVAEEKSSRVMEIVLGAAKPFELMTGKVIGVGALGLAQYAIVFIPTVLAIVFQDRIAALILGGTASSGLPSGLTVPLLVAFGVFFVLGFALYATLYAGVASLVSRQEDVNQIIGPLTMISTAGYMIAAYSSSGLIEMSSTLVRLLSYIPFLSPYIMLSRMALGQVEPWEPILAIAILVVTILGALWLAARIYGAGVLLYGQKPSLRNFVQALRSG